LRKANTSSGLAGRMHISISEVIQIIDESIKSLPVDPFSDHIRGQRVALTALRSQMQCVESTMSGAESSGIDLSAVIDG